VAASMEFCLLGPVVTRCDGRALPVSAGQQRTLLAALLLNVGRVVPTPYLIEVLWGSEPPPSAPASLQNCMKRLRRALGDSGRARISTHQGGYLITVEPGELDTVRAEEFLRSARESAISGSWPSAAELAAAGLSLWRGEPLTGVDSQALEQQEIPRLREIQLQLWETRIGAELQLNHHDEVVTELYHLTAAHPLREHLHALLMQALYGQGRQAEALAAYQDVRRTLIDELGAEPGAELRELHQRILAADPVGEVPELASSSAPVDLPVPRELPGAVRQFTGRGAELAALTGLLDPGLLDPGLIEEGRAHRRETIVISAIGGTAGVGKTALALRWAHQVAERFPDGQLYVNLRGYDPDQLMPPGDALAGFLRALGVSGEDIPPREEDRAARYRSLLSGRRILVVLDNARDVAQVRPLLPGSATCVTVVTSRDMLAGLVARDGAYRLELDLLPPTEATDLLRTLIGERAVRDPNATNALAQACCRLPLALRVAAELAAARPAMPIAKLAGELADRQRRLELLDAGGDQRTMVRAVFSWSYQHLDAAAARAFRLVSLHPGPQFDRYSTAALTGTTAREADQMLAVLACGHLVQPAGLDRYTMHDLLRGYARDLAAAGDGEEAQRAALTRLFDYYLQTAADAMDVMHPAERHRRPRIHPSTAPGRPLATSADSHAWLDSERASLVAVATYTARNGWPGHTTALSATLFRYLDVGSHFPEALTIHSYARQAASQVADRPAECAALISLGCIEFRQCRYRQARGYFRGALALAREVGDQVGEARTLQNLGLVDLQQGRYEQAADYLAQALPQYRAVGDRSGEARTLANLGGIEMRQGRYEQASSHLQQALVLNQESGDRHCATHVLIDLGLVSLRLGRLKQAGNHEQRALDLARGVGDQRCEAYALGNLGMINLRQGRYEQATDHLTRALDLSREISERNGEADALCNLGLIDLRQGRIRQAEDHLQRALALAHETGDRSRQAEALNSLGEVALAARRPEEARAHHSVALRLARSTGNKYEQARGYDGLARGYRASHDSAAAWHSGEKALSIYAALNVPETRQVRAWLDLIAMDEGSPPGPQLDGRSRRRRAVVAAVEGDRPVLDSTGVEPG
jgi:tetratricopeptide (TPR) repeat protein/DNA-binding SARP family transcriptional activator